MKSRKTSERKTRPLWNQYSEELELTNATWKMKHASRSLFHWFSFSFSRRLSCLRSEISILSSRNLNFQTNVFDRYHEYSCFNRLMDYDTTLNPLPEIKLFTAGKFSELWTARFRSFTSKLGELNFVIFLCFQLSKCCFKLCNLCA